MFFNSNLDRHGIYNKEGAVERTNSNQESEQHAEKIIRDVLDTHAGNAHVIVMSHNMVIDAYCSHRHTL